MSTPHCRIAFIKPSTDPEDKSETPYFANFTILLTKTGFKSSTVLANTGNYENLTALTNINRFSLKYDKTEI